MKNKRLQIAFIIGLMMVLVSCGTKQKVITTSVKDIPHDTVESVLPISDVISVAEAVEMYETPNLIPVITKKYGYKLKKGYEVYRLDNFSKMYYKNCVLSKLLTKTAYADYPKPLAKGVSSYIAFKDGAMIIAVFNLPAYNNLVAQVKANGFVLDMQGSEDIYKKGERTIACYQAGKSIRIQ